MSNNEPNNHCYEPAVRSLGLIEGAIIVMIVGAMAVVQWLDEQPLKVLGWILFPVEFLLNAVFFPGVHTPLRSNAVALFVALPTFALLYAAYRLSKALLSLIGRSRSERS